MFPFLCHGKVVFLSANDVSLNLSQVFIYSYGQKTFSQHQTKFVNTSITEFIFILKFFCQIFIKHLFMIFLLSEKSKINKPSFTFINPNRNLQSMHAFTFDARLSARFDSKLDINLRMLLNFILQDMVFGLISFPFLPILLTSFFLIETEKILYFLVFSPKHLKYSLNSSASSVVMKFQL